MTAFNLRVGSATHVGQLRKINQDAIVTDGGIFGVADGMGGHQGGEVASAVAVEVIGQGMENATPAGFEAAVKAANRAVYEQGQARDDLAGMGTTLVAIAEVTVDDEPHLVIVNVGDSRGYLLRDRDLVQITEDHSLVADLVRAGRITPEEAEHHPRRNIVTRVLGLDDTVRVDQFAILPFEGDRFLMCSDGLTNEVSAADITSTLRRIDDPDEAADELVRMANESGGRDNISVVIVDVLDEDGRSVRAGGALAGESADPEPTEVAGPEDAPSDDDADESPDDEPNELDALGALGSAAAVGAAGAMGATDSADAAAGVGASASVFPPEEAEDTPDPSAEAPDDPAEPTKTPDNDDDLSTVEAEPDQDAGVDVDVDVDDVDVDDEEVETATEPGDAADIDDGLDGELAGDTQDEIVGLGDYPSDPQSDASDAEDDDGPPAGADDTTSDETDAEPDEAIPDATGTDPTDEIDEPTDGIAADAHATDADDTGGPDADDADTHADPDGTESGAILPVDTESDTAASGAEDEDEDEAPRGRRARRRAAAAAAAAGGATVAAQTGATTAPPSSEKASIRAEQAGGDRSDPAPTSPDDSTDGPRATADLAGFGRALDDDQLADADADILVEEDLDDLIPKRRRFSWRVAAFLFIFCAVIGIAIGALGVYARGTYYVGFDNNRVAIFQGRPGGVLFFDPTVEAHSNVVRTDLLPVSAGQVDDRPDFGTFSEADLFIGNLQLVISDKTPVVSQPGSFDSSPTPTTSTTVAEEPLSPDAPTPAGSPTTTTP